MFRRRAQANEVTLDLGRGAGERGSRAAPNSEVHDVGETTGMFRFRTARGIRVEVEEEMEPAQFRELVRRYGCAGTGD